MNFAIYIVDSKLHALFPLWLMMHSWGGPMEVVSWKWSRLMNANIHWTNVFMTHSNVHIELWKWERVIFTDDLKYRLILSMYSSTYSPCWAKLKSEGNSMPLGMRDPGCRSSLKNGWAHASMGLMREEGVYSKSRLTRSIASGGVRGLNTYR